MTLVATEERHGFDVLRLDSPGNRNALSLRLIEELRDGVRRSASGPARGLVLEHSGAAFCAGVDLKERQALPVDDASHTEGLAALLLELWEHPRPVVAVVDGAVRGGGMGLVACADVVVATPRSSFAYSEVRVGVAPALVLDVTLAHLAPRRLLPHVLDGAEFGTAVALDLGLVSHLAEDATAEADRVLAELAQAAPRAQELVKKLVRGPNGAELRHRLAETVVTSTDLFSRPEAAEGMVAFAERRRPAWAPA